MSMPPGSLYSSQSDPNSPPLERQQASVGLGKQEYKHEGETHSILGSVSKRVQGSVEDSSLQQAIDNEAVSEYERQRMEDVRLHSEVILSLVDEGDSDEAPPLESSAHPEASTKDAQETMEDVKAAVKRENILVDKALKDGLVDVATTQHHSMWSKDVAELQEQLSPAMQARSKAILAAVGDEGDSDDSMNGAKDKELEKLRMRGQNTVHLSRAVSMTSKSGSNEFADALPTKADKRVVSDPTSVSLAEKIKLRERNGAGVPNGAGNGTKPKGGSGEKGEYIPGELAQTTLSRDGRLPVQPGALRVQGIDASDEDEHDGLHKLSHEKQEDDHESSPINAVLATDDPIQAVLVEEEESTEENRQRELAEREAKIAERERDLERKLKEMTMGQAVQAQVVATPETEKRKKKGLFGRFRRSQSLTGESDKKVLNSPTKSSQRHSDTSQLVASSGGREKLVANAVDEHLGTTSREVRRGPSDLVEFAKQFNRKPISSIPLYRRDEIRTGARIGEGRYNAVQAVSRVALDQSWCLPALQASDMTAEDVAAQPSLRESFGKECNSSGKVYVLKSLQSGLEPRRASGASLELMAEASLLTAMSHDHIVEVAALCEGSLSLQNGSRSPNPSFFFVVEQLQDNFFDRLTKKGWGSKVKAAQFLADRIQIAADLASAIDYLHSLNIIYCDLKPERVGFDSKGRVKLYSFGGAKVLTNTSKPYDLHRKTLNASVGTHPYVAPEVALKRPAGIGADTYAYGLVLWELMTLKEPFAGLMIHEYTEKVIRQQHRPKLSKKTPESLNEIISSCWQHDAKARPPMQEVHRSLRDFQQNHQTPAAKRGFFR